MCLNNTVRHAKMTTRTKLHLSLLTTCVMMLPSIFSRPLGISGGVHWALLIGVTFPLGLVFHYTKKLKEERAREAVSAVPPASEFATAQKKTRKRFIVIWICVVAYSLAAPVWLPITGATLGVRGDLLIGVAIAFLVSVIFVSLLLKMPNNPVQETPAKAADPDL